MNNPKNPFQVDIVVRPGDIDDLGHVNNVVYVQWAQEVASRHWQSAAPTELQAKYLWVVLRHEIDYKHPAFLNEEIKALTWVAEYSGPKSIRFIRFLRGEKTICEVKTTWCLLDAQQMRPTRITDQLASIFI